MVSLATAGAVNRALDDMASMLATVERTRSDPSDCDEAVAAAAAAGMTVACCWACMKALLEADVAAAARPSRQPLVSVPATLNTTIISEIEV